MPAALRILDQDSARNVVVGLSKIGMALKSRFWKQGQGLTPTQGQILVMLNARPGMQVTGIAKNLGITPATASDAVQALERKHLIRRSRSEADGRAFRLALTRKGAREARRVAGWPDFLIAAVQVLSFEEREVFLRGLMKMIRALQERGEIPVSRMCVTCRFFVPNVYPDPERPHHCNFVDAPFGDLQLRLDCSDYEVAESSKGKEIT